jgi:LmbE family N-acetylglucosaminyl deacetylase
VVVLIAATAISVISAANRIRTENIEAEAVDLGRWPEPKRSDRILIFAPHCDDETLGLSGYLQKATRAGAAVRVVFMTNGDGFRWSAERQLRRFRVSPKGFVQFGEERQTEALAALAESGVSNRDAVFLGYPDRGLASLWLYDWLPSKPYRSGTTGHTRSPYADSYTPNAVYCGQSVMSDVTRLLHEFRPTQVFCPHPNENHPDHWATYAFVTNALYELRREAKASVLPLMTPPPEPVQGLYIIHRGDWPVPQGYHPTIDLPPPAGLLEVDTRWKQIPLSPEEEAVKRVAIRQYRSQTRVMNRFLMSFVRTNEIAGLRRPGRITEVPDGTMKIDGSLADWENIPLSVHDPAEDSLPSDFGASGDITGIAVAQDSRRLYVRIETRKPVSPRIAYDLYWHPLPDLPAGTKGISLRLRRRPPAAVHAAAVGNSWEVALPRQPGTALFLGVQCRYGRFTLDKSGWRILEVEK